MLPFLEMQEGNLSVATHLWYLVYSGSCFVFDHHKIFAIYEL